MSIRFSELACRRGLPASALIAFPAPRTSTSFAVPGQENLRAAAFRPDPLPNLAMRSAMRTTAASNTEPTMAGTL
jgi:hypothetical protein